MKLKNGMMLYHGSYTPVQNIDLTKCAAGKTLARDFMLQPMNFRLRIS